MVDEHVDTVPLIAENSVNSNKTVKGELTMYFYYQEDEAECDADKGKPKKISEQDLYNLSKICNEEMPDAIKMALFVAVYTKKKDSASIRKILDALDKKQTYDAKELKISDS